MCHCQYWISCLGLLSVLRKKLVVAALAEIKSLGWFVGGPVIAVWSYRFRYISTEKQWRQLV